MLYASAFSGGIRESPQQMFLFQQMLRFQTLQSLAWLGCCSLLKSLAHTEDVRGKDLASLIMGVLQELQPREDKRKHGVRDHARGCGGGP